MSRTIHIHGGGDMIEVELGPISETGVHAAHGVQAELVINVGQQEIEASLTDGERRELIRALGGRN